jgi:predicted transcriptional regulator
MKALENVGLIIAKRNGQSITFSVNLEVIKEIQDFLK